MELILVLMFVPRSVTAPTTTTATRARIRPYSAMPWPSSRYFRLAMLDRIWTKARSITDMMVLPFLCRGRLALVYLHLSPGALGGTGLQPGAHNSFTVPLRLLGPAVPAGLGVQA